MNHQVVKIHSDELYLKDLYSEVAEVNLNIWNVIRNNILSEKKRISTAFSIAKYHRPKWSPWWNILLKKIIIKVHL